MMHCLSGRLFALLLLGALVMPSPTSAKQPPSGPGPWWKVADVQRELGLTPEQVLKIDTIWETTRPEMMQDRQDLEKFETELSKRIKRKRPEAEIVMAIDRVESSRARLNKTRTLMLYRMRLVLSDEQNEKLQAMQERWQQNNAGRGAPGSKPQGTPR